MGKDSERNMGIDEIRRLPENRVEVVIPLDSPAYVAYLEANRKREQAREETGGPDPEAEEAYRKACQELGKFAQSLIGENRRLP